MAIMICENLRLYLRLSARTEFCCLKEFQRQFTQMIANKNAEKPSYTHSEQEKKIKSRPNFEMA